MITSHTAGTRQDIAALRSENIVPVKNAHEMKLIKSSHFI
jgi:hypothetical protein